MSQKNEEVGSVFFPTKRYSDFENNKDSVNIGVWHHPYNWFTPNSIDSNKLEFETFTEKIASTHLFGHEHEQSLYEIENKNTGKRLNLLSGEIFNNDKKNQKSGFQILILDLLENIGAQKKYQWNKDIYSNTEQKNIELFKESGQSFIAIETFTKQLQELKIPLAIENKRDIKLSDIYVFPDIEQSTKDSNRLENYLNSSRFLNSDNEYCIIDGESQVGKSSLLSMLYLKFFELGIYPILINGKDIKEPNLDKIIKKAFRLQYKNTDTDFDKFIQLDKSKKVLLIDDYNECAFNVSTTQEFYNEAILKFGKVFSIFDSANNILTSIKTILKDFKYYTIKPLGYKKRNELIERYHHLKQDPLTVDDSLFLEEVKNTFDNVQSIIGDKLIPAYPVYILSIIQALQYKPLKQNETSFGYCYQTLIHYSLFKAGISNDELDTYFNFLSELAYEFIKKNQETLSRTEMSDFYSSYSKKFICDTFESMLSSLKKSKIIQVENDVYKFCYNYILYYLSAKKISDIIHTKEGKEVMKYLFAEMHIERNANILVFITHHTKDITFIESSLLNSMIVLENTRPITLEKNDPFYKEISSFVEKLKIDIINSNSNARDERNKQLVRQDKVIREKESKNINDNSEIISVMLPFYQSFRSIEIVGQIIKNRKGSLEIPQLKSMITELYTTGFRTIGYYNELINAMKEDIIALINEELKDGDGRTEIEARINEFVQMMSFKICLGIFTKLMFTIGVKDLKKLYTEVATEINTPAAKLVSFSINSYHGSINPDELKKLVDEFKGNIVALRILRSRVRSYVYNRNLDISMKQKYASILNMTLSSMSSKPNDRK